MKTIHSSRKIVQKSNFTRGTAVVTRHRIVFETPNPPDNKSFSTINLSTSNLVFPYYQGESAIVDKGIFLYQTPDTKNL